jgi:cysteine-rich repeat protein
VPVCGDGIIVSPNEECDDGNAFSYDGCSNKCTIEPHYSCYNLNNSTPSICYMK